MVSETICMLFYLLSNIMTVRGVEIHRGHCCRPVIAIGCKHITDLKRISDRHLHGEKG